MGYHTDCVASAPVAEVQGSVKSIRSTAQVVVVYGYVLTAGIIFPDRRMFSTQSRCAMTFDWDMSVLDFGQRWVGSGGQLATVGSM